MRVLAVAALCAGLYLYRFGASPPYFGGDEAHFGVQSYALAYTGRDLNGRTFPLFFNLADPAGDPQNHEAARRWYQPTYFYLAVPILRVFPFSEASVRAPALLCGLINVVLIGVVASRIGPSRSSGWLAAGLLAITPAHFIFSRQATDYICPLPYVIAWVWCLLLAANDNSRARVSLLAGITMGLGVYSYIAAWVLMPLLLLLYLVACRSWRHRVAAIAGFTLCLVPLVIWLTTHPEMLRDTLGRYGATATSPHLATRVVDRITVYASYFDPWLLFLRGGVSLTAATARSGVFLLPIAILLPAGLYALVKGLFPRAVKIALIGGALVAPIPATLVGEPYMIQRALSLVPFVILISVIGAQVMLRQSGPMWRVVTFVLLALGLLQFGYFYRDYFGHYERRAAVYFDPHVFEDVAAFVLATDATDAVPAVYLSRQLDDAPARWRFQLTKHGRVDLLDRTRYFDGDGLDLGGTERGSLIVVLADGALIQQLLDTRHWSLASAIRNNDGADASVVLRKAD